MLLGDRNACFPLYTLQACSSRTRVCNTYGDRNLVQRLSCGTTSHHLRPRVQEQAQRPASWVRQPPASGRWLSWCREGGESVHHGHISSSCMLPCTLPASLPACPDSPSGRLQAHSKICPTASAITWLPSTGFHASPQRFSCSGAVGWMGLMWRS